jgi:acylphosphatase
MVSSEQRRLTAQVTGRVQGVGFRHFTRQQARGLGLAGWVMNEPDGSVSVVAEGPADSLEALVEALRRGPAGARVREVDTQWSEPRGGHEAFEVRFA